VRTIPTGVPRDLTAGVTWQWTEYLSDYRPADGWALSYVLVGSTFLELAEGAEITAAETHWTVKVPAAMSRELQAGRYRVAAYVAKDGDRFEVLRGVVALQPNLATLEDGRSKAERELELVDAAIAKRLPADLESYAINGRQLNHIPIAELYRIRGLLRSQVWRDRNPGRLGPTVRIRFGRA
jgi:hypothetical protein